MTRPINDTATRTAVRPAKRARPPNLTLGVKSLRFPPQRPITIETVQAVGDDDDADAEEDAAVENEVWSSPSSGTSSPLGGDSHSTESDSELSDDLSKNLERLEKLRQNVHRNLRLRPLRSATAPPDSPSSAAHATRVDAASVALARSHQHRPGQPLLCNGRLLSCTVTGVQRLLHPHDGVQRVADECTVHWKCQLE